MRTVIITDTTIEASYRPGGRHPSFREQARLVEELRGAGISALDLDALHVRQDGAIIGETFSALAGDMPLSVPIAAPDEAAAAFECVKKAAHPRLRICLPASTVQMEYVSHLKEDAMLALIADTVKAAKNVCADVEWVALDASRAEESFLEKAVSAALEFGCGTVTLCDDAGTLLPGDWAEWVRRVKRPGLTVMAQLNDDMHMAAACALEALRSGADGIKTALTPGALSPLTLCAVLARKGEDLGLKTALDETRFARLVEDLTAPRPDQSALYQEDESIYLDQAATMTDLKNGAQKLGYTLSEEDLGHVEEEFRRIMATKDSIGARELDALIAAASMQVPSSYHVVSYMVSSGSSVTAMAQVTLRREDETMLGVSSGDGPIDAAFKAIENVVGCHYELDEFRIQAITEGREALGSSVIRLRDGGRLYAGTGISPDIIGACIRAYINALNKIVYEGN